MLKNLYAALVVSTALACHASTSQPVNVAGSNDLKPDEQQSVVLQKVAQLITSYNYKRVELNDSISAVVFDRYIDALDGNHNYLLKADIDGFQKYRTQLDDDMKEGNLNGVFYIFNVYQKRYNERIQYSLSQVSKAFDYTKKENFIFERDSLPWVASENEMNQLWTKRVKYDMLNLKLANADVAKNRETLKKRYENLLAQSNKLSNQDVFQLFMNSFTEAVDPHTDYFTPSNAANFNIEMSRSVTGIGATLAVQNEYVTIKSVVPGGPADKSKQINVDDRIVAVAQGKDGEFKNVIGWRIDNAIALIRGQKGTTVRLEILPGGAAASAKPKVVEMVREKIILKDQSAQKEIKTYEQNGKTYKIGVISIPAFYMDFEDYRSGNPNYKSTTRDVKLLLDTLKQQNVDGVVIDLRQNGGGSLTEAIDLTGLFIKTGPVVQVKDSRGEIEVDKDEDAGVAYSGPLLITVDRFSASASEIFAGAIQDYGRGLIVGTQTYGKGTVQSAINLDKVISSSLADKLAGLVGKDTKTTGNQNRFGQLNLTVAKFYRISGASTQHKGVIPDISFPSIIPLDKYGEDTEPSALPYDIIPKSDFERVGDFSNVLSQLKKQHDERMAKSDSYKYLLDDVAEIKKHEAETTVSLNEQEVKKEREEDEKSSFERANARRVAMGLPPLKKGQTKPRNEDLDFVKQEAGKILIDYITLENKITGVNVQ